MSGVDSKIPIDELRRAIAKAAVEIARGEAVIVSDPQAFADTIIGRGRVRLDLKTLSEASTMAI